MTGTGHEPPAGPIGGQAAIDMTALEDTVGFLLKRGQIVFSRRMHAAFADLEITTVQFSAMAVIARNPGIPQGELAAALEVERPRIVPVLDSLERRGLAARQQDSQDRRSRRIHLTGDGAEMLAELQSRFDELEARVRVALGPQLRDDLVAALRVVADLP